MSHASIIASSEFFSAASPAVIDTIAASAQEKNLVRGDVLFKEGDAPDALYIVLSGRIAIAID
ncbi:MAG: cyclic nucleotide-binding domain-containing protein, partial [Actinomycetes bacterium]